MLSACLPPAAIQTPWSAEADSAQASVSGELAGVAIAAKDVSSAAAAAAKDASSAAAAAAKDASSAAAAAAKDVSSAAAAAANQHDWGETPGPMLTFAYLQYGLSADGLQNSAATSPRMTSHAFLRVIATFTLLVFCVLECSAVT